MIRETTGSIVTTYYAPLGELLGFDISGTSYFVHSDALGSVRKITDSTGTVVSAFDYDAWGNQLPSTSDGLNFPYRFVGALGIRYDATTGLYYMRQRWYDAPTLQRFINRDRTYNKSASCYTGRFPRARIDPSATLDTNLYGYVANMPTTLVDPEGLKICIGWRPLAQPNYAATGAYHNYLVIDGTAYGFGPPGVFNTDPTASNPSKGIFLADISGACDETCLADYIKNSTPPKYDVANYNCYHWVRDMLQNSGCCDMTKLYPYLTKPGTIPDDVRTYREDIQC